VLTGVTTQVRTGNLQIEALLSTHQESKQTGYAILKLNKGENETVSTYNWHTAGGGISVCGVMPLPSTYTRPYCVTLTVYFHNPLQHDMKTIQLLTENCMNRQSERAMSDWFVRHKCVPTADQEIMLSQKVGI
jgi:hypothetical protein